MVYASCNYAFIVTRSGSNYRCPCRQLIKRLPCILSSFPPRYCQSMPFKRCFSGAASPAAIPYQESSARPLLLSSLIA